MLENQHPQICLERPLVVEAALGDEALSSRELSEEAALALFEAIRGNMMTRYKMIQNSKQKFSIQYNLIR